MANSVSTIQSLKAVDAWIDVINANINGGVRTAFKSSRLRFAGSNTQLDRPPTASSLPLQFPEPSLITANTVIDFSQGAITSSTETTHLAIQGEGFFLLISPESIISDPASANFGTTLAAATPKFLLTRDGEFHTDANGLLRSANGYYLVTVDLVGGVPNHSTTASLTASRIRAVVNDIDGPPSATARSIRLSAFLTGTITHNAEGSAFGAAQPQSLVHVGNGQQNLTYSQFGSTVFAFGYTSSGGAALGAVNPQIQLRVADPADYSLLSKSLEASNSSMTQSVPELSLAQKLFSALTKVIQIHQTNLDSVLNTIR